MKKLLPFLLTALLAGNPVFADQTAGGGGVNVGKASPFRNLVPAEQLEGAANQQYSQMMQQAAQQGALAPANHPQLQRLRAIAQRILPHASRFNPRAERWKWEVNLVNSKQLNAFCMPGGKIAFFTGLIDNLQLTDDEIAVVMGHEVAHALREHARARLAKNTMTQLGAAVLGEWVGGGKYAGAFRWGGDFVTLKFSRDDETEADTVGLDLAARAGYDPRAGISLWKKMGAASQRGVQMAWFSTHPAGTDRIKEIERHLPEVMPLYEASKGKG